MLGLVTIGQAPRADIVESMFGADCRIDALEIGALDELDPAEIKLLAPEPADTALVSRLRDGSEVVMGESRLMPYLQQAIKRAESAGCDVIGVLCTGTSVDVDSRSMLVFPDRVVTALINAVQPRGILGVLMPHADQEAMMRSKWSHPARSVVMAVASPYSAKDQIADQVQALSMAGAELIVLDCMGFDRNMLATAREAVSVPVVLSNAIVGALLLELAG